jgi:4-amino-4-deoxy-L-arabinose transferase-like glycosyltransferase
MQKSKTIYILFILYFLSRLVNLNSLPVFADEAIYIRWSQLIIDDITKAFVPMYDGKPPLFMWLTIPFLKFIQDPLIAARLLSVFLGAGTTFLIFKSAYNFFNKKTSYWTAVFAVSCPFLFIYSRMALIESLLTFTLSLQIYFLSLYKKKNKLIYIVLSGLAWGLSMLSKTTAFFFFTLYLPTGFYLKGFNILKFAKMPKILIKNKKTIFSLFLAGFLAFLIFGITKLSVFFPFLFTRSRDFSYTVTEFINREYKYIFVRGVKIFKWIGYYTSPLLILIFLGSAVFLSKIGKNKQNIITHLWLFVAVLVIPFITFGKILAPRYLLPITLPIILIASYVIAETKALKKIKLPVVILIMAFNMSFIGISLNDIDKTPFLEVDKVQYLQEWSSGHGIKQAFLYLKDLAENQKVLVGTEGYYGTLPDGLLIYKDAYAVSNFEIIGVGQPISAVPQEILEKSSEQSTFLLGNSHRFIFPESEPLKLIKSYERPAGGPKLLLYEVINEN